ncbi:hypothetical protein [Paenibacillus cymbidii]|uniref:hypothetical protein n=1 Tax=Paenibacillus cymbidii TaxID=1639034 RepID=UPI00107FE44A|nr:hypothetical protein [Paenibacillus cymbidii]
MEIGYNNKYRSQMPVTNCPPDSAKSKDLNDVYRLTLNNPPKEEDFQSHIESGRKYPPGKECEAASVSVFKDIQEASRKKKMIPAFKRHGHIVMGQIKASTGVVSESTVTSHVDWWIYRGQTVHHLFK